MKKCLTILPFLFCWFHTISQHLVNEGVKIKVSKDGLLYLPGNYIREKDNIAAEFPKLIIMGELRVDGNIDDQDGESLINESSTGILNLTGTGDQYIKASVPVFIPRLTLNKSAGRVYTQSDLLIDKSLTFGNNTRLFPGSNSIRLASAFSSLLSESNSSHVSGKDAVINSPDDYLIPSGLNLTSLMGIGLSVDTKGGPAFSNTRIRRYHKPFSNVGRAGSINKHFTLETNLSGSFNRLRFQYFSSDIPGSLTESNLLLFYSQDAGTTWRKKSGTVSVNNNYVEVLKLPLSNGKNILTLAEDCDPVSPRINSTIPRISGVVNLCGDVSTELSYNGNPVFYHWEKVGSTDTLAANTHVSVNQSGTYKLTVRTSRGCEFINKIKVRKRSLPQAKISYSPSASLNFLCEGTTVDYSGASSISDGIITDFFWKTGTGFSRGNTTKSLKYNKSGLKSTYLHVKDQFNCQSDTAVNIIDIFPKPVPAFATSATSYCQETTISVTNESSFEYAGTIYPLDYNFTFQNQSSDNQNPAFTAGATGDEYVMLEVQPVDPSISCKVKDSLLIEVLPKPVADFEMQIEQAEVSQSCEGELIQLQNKSEIEDNSGLSYIWDLGDGTSSIDRNLSHQYLVASEKEVVLQVISEVHGCRDTLQNNFTVHPVPKGSFYLQKQSICAFDSLLIENATISDEPVDYTWQFGNASETTSERQFYRSFPASGRYEITLNRRTIHGCENSVTKTLEVYDRPEVDFKFFNERCAGSEIKFENLTQVNRGTITGYRWTIGGEASMEEEEPTYAFSDSGTYEIKLTVNTEEGCSSEKRDSLFIKPVPQIGNVGPFISCSDSFVLDSDQLEFDSDNMDQVEWYSSDGQLLSNLSSFEVFESGLYSLQLAQSGCSNSYELPVKIADRILHEDSIFFCDTSTYAPAITDDVQSLIFLDSDGQTISYESLFLEETADFMALSTYEFAGSTCRDTAQIHVLRSIPFDFELPATVDLCEGAETKLEVDSMDVDYEWIKLDQSEIVGTHHKLRVSEPGIYQLATKNKACETTNEIQVIERARPVVSFELEKNKLCEGDSVKARNLTYLRQNSDDELHYSWKLDDQTISDRKELRHEANNAGLKELKLVAQSEYGCSGEYGSYIELDRPPDLLFDPKDRYCEGEELLLFAGVENIKYFLESSLISEDDSVLHSLASSGKFEIGVQAEAGACRVSEVHQIIVNPVPIVNFQDTVTDCSEEIQLSVPNDLKVEWIARSDGKVLTEDSIAFFGQEEEIIVSAQNLAGCHAADTFFVKPGLPPVVDLGKDRQVCQPITLDAGYFERGTFVWNTGALTRNIDADTSGVYVVSVTDREGCVAVDSIELEVSQLPGIDLGPDFSACDDEVVVLKNDVPVTWSTGHIKSKIRVDSSGLYWASIAEGECVNSDTIKVTILETPEVRFAKDYLCQGADIQLFNLSQLDEKLEYSWYVDGQLVSKRDSLDIETSLPASYHMQLTAKNASSCIASDTSTLVIAASPDAFFQVKNSCEGDSLLFDTREEYTESKWRIGKETFSDQSLPALLPAGDYHAVRIVTNAQNCSASKQQYFSIQERPAFNFPKTEDCLDSLYLELPIDSLRITWGKGLIFQPITIRESGTYAFHLENKTGCVNQQTLEVKINPFAGLSFQDDYEACGNLSLSHSVQDASTFWSDGSTSTQTTFFETNEKSYVRLVSRDLCVFTDTFAVQINEVPIVNLQDEVEICRGDKITLDAFHPAASQYDWSTGHQSSSVDLTEEGEYYVTISTASGCSYSDSVDVAEFEPPQDVLPDSIVSCGPTILNAGNEGSFYSWITGSIGSSITALTSGTYEVTITNLQECQLKDEIYVVVHDIPVVDLGEDITSCYNTAVELQTSDDWQEWFWSTGQFDRKIQVRNTGEYWVKVWDENGCTAIDDVIVEFREKLQTGLENQYTICSDDGLFLEVNDELFESVSWYKDEILLSSLDTITIGQPGTYRASFSDEYNCQGEQQLTIRESKEKIQASFLFPSVANSGDLINFNLLTDPIPAAALWDFGDGAYSNELHPKHRYRRLDTFNVKLTVSNLNCSDQIEKDIIITNEDLMQHQGRFRAPVIEKAILYPNPTVNHINLDIRTSEVAQTAIYVMDVSGEIISSIDQLLYEDKVKISTVDLAPGTYILAIVVGRQMELLRFIKN